MWSEAWDEIGPIAQRAFNGEATFFEDFPLVVERHGYPEQAYFTFCYSPIRDENGTVLGMMDTVIETTGKVEAAERTKLLNGELEHRIRNLLTVTSAIVNQTLRGTESTALAGPIISRRLDALSRAQLLLTQSGKEISATVADVVAQALDPYSVDPGEIAIEGPPVTLSSKQALSLALGINELATNALKYGALSTKRGTVRIAWGIEDGAGDAIFRLTWIETGGPAVTAPTRRGFGTRIIEDVVARDFMGETSVSYAPDGFAYTLSTATRYLGT